MDTTKKIVAFGMGVVVIGGLAWFIMSRKKSSSQARMSDPLILPPMPMATTDNTSAVQDLGPYGDSGIQSTGQKINIMNAKGNGKYRWYGTMGGNDRTRLNAAAQIGTVGLVNGTETCTISDFWINEKGQKAAFRCEEKADGSYDIPTGSRFEF
tara:strand:- start:1127 stop:1588 length:462 start_codon:yes stop_codon:yes gene_type:complete